MWPGQLVYVWRPVESGRHAFPAGARAASPDEIVVAYCGLEVRAGDLHGLSEMDWIQRDSCMTCWRILDTSNTATAAR